MWSSESYQSCLGAGIVCPVYSSFFFLCDSRNLANVGLSAVDSAYDGGEAVELAEKNRLRFFPS